MRPTRFIGEDRLTIGTANLGYAFPFAPGSTDDEVIVMKTRPLIESYLELFERIMPGSIVELGIMAGGSTAMIAAMTDPSCHVAFELSPDRVEPLDRFLAAENLADRVHCHYGVDQADVAALSAVLDAHFGTGPLDLVIDDASHIYGPTRASFELLYPRLRPGGVYIIEDWTGTERIGAVVAEQVGQPAGPARDQVVASLVTRSLSDASDDRSETASMLRSRVAAFEATPTSATLVPMSQARARHVGDVPLSRLAAELVIAVAETPALFGDIRITDDWIEISRSDATLDSATFSLTGACPDYFGVLHH